MKFTPSRHSFAKPNPPAGAKTLKLGPPEEETPLVAKAAGLGVLLLGPLVITPFILKAFKPEWSYSRRLGVGLGISVAFGAIRSITRKEG